MKKEKGNKKIEMKKEKKIILVDAVNCLVNEKGEVNEELKNYLDTLENKKIILTNAPKEKHKIFFKNIKDYEIFTLENNPGKNDPEYYKKFLDRFKLTSKEVIYFDHDEESVKSAKSVGINAIIYKNNLDEIKEFIDKNIKSETVEIKKEEKHGKKPEIKKSLAVVNAQGLPISTKTSSYVCKFIKNKKIEDAIEDLKQVILKKKAIPMKGEIPHRKGKIMSGRFPRNAAMHFIKLLKSLSANSVVNGISNPIISEAIANIASRPYSKFGAVRKKRTHVKLVAREKSELNKSRNKKLKK